MLDDLFGYFKWNETRFLLKLSANGLNYLRSFPRYKDLMPHDVARAALL